MTRTRLIGLGVGCLLTCGLIGGVASAQPAPTAAVTHSASSSAAQQNNQGSHSKPVDILKVSGLTAKDLENVALIYKTDSEEGDNQYPLEYKFARAAAALGSPDAMLWLGEMYQGQHLVNHLTAAQDVKTAITWWLQAAAHGQPRGWTNIGLLYMHTTIPGGGSNFAGIAENDATALRYLLRANQHGDVKAARYLGLMYQDGVGVTADVTKAAQYFKTASERGDSTGTVYYADYLLVGKGVAQNVQQAITLYQQLIDTKAHDIGTAAYKLGVIYEQGVYASADLTKALSYYKIALANGNTDAQAAIDRLSP